MDCDGGGDGCWRDGINMGDGNVAAQLQWAMAAAMK